MSPKICQKRIYQGESHTRRFPKLLFFAKYRESPDLGDLDLRSTLKSVNVNYFMLIDLSRVFTPDKSYGSAQFLWNILALLLFFILRTLVGKTRDKSGTIQYFTLIDLSRVFTPDKSCDFTQNL